MLRKAHLGAFQQHLQRRPIFCSTLIVLVVTVILLLGYFFPFTSLPRSSAEQSAAARKELERWHAYTLPEAAHFVAQNSTVILCAVSQPYLPLLINWLITIARHRRHQAVLVIAEDYATLYAVNERWPGHAVLVPPAPALQQAHEFGSQGFFNFTSRRPRHLLQVLELGYSVLYNDVDIVWLKDPFTYFEGTYDIYFTDDMTQVKPLNHSHKLPPPGENGSTYICSCTLFIRPTDGGKLILRKWIEEVEAQTWSERAKTNDQPAFNQALNKTADTVKLYLLPQQAFPSGGLYFENEMWRGETRGKQAIVHNNYIVGFEMKIKRFRDFNLWFVDEGDDNDPTEALAKFISSICNKLPVLSESQHKSDSILQIVRAKLIQLASHKDPFEW